MYKPEDLSTPTKRPVSGTGFIINTSKALVMHDDQMEIDDDDDDDQNEISDEDHRGIVLPSVVQPSVKQQQINRKSKQQVQQQMEKESRQNPDDEEIHVDQDINSTRKKYQEKVEF